MSEDFAKATMTGGVNDNNLSQNGIEKHLIAGHCYALVGGGCNHTTIEHRTTFV